MTRPTTEDIPKRLRIEVQEDLSAEIWDLADQLHITSEEASYIVVYGGMAALRNAATALDDAQDVVDEAIADALEDGVPVDANGWREPWPPVAQPGSGVLPDDTTTTKENTMIEVEGLTIPKPPEGVIAVVEQRNGRVVWAEVDRATFADEAPHLPQRLDDLFVKQARELSV